MGRKQVLTEASRVYEGATALDWRILQDILALNEKVYREAGEAFEQTIAQAEKEWQEASAPAFVVYQGIMRQARRGCK